VKITLSILLVVTLILSVIGAAGCGGKSDSSTTKSGGQTTNSTSGQTTTATSTVPNPSGFPDIADMKSLSSYRLSIMNKGLKGIAAGTVSYLKYEWVRDMKAEHSWMEDANGKVTEVYIKIGETYWIWFGVGDMGWVKQPPQTTTPPSSISSDLAAQLKQVMADVKNSKARFDKKGTETVNNVNCILYEFDYNLTTELPNFSGGKSTTVEHSSGNMWIANQSGLPAVIIKSKSTSELTMDGEKTVMETEYNLTDIGTAITINPPEGAFTPPTGTTDLSKSTTTKTTPTTTTTKTTSTTKTTTTTTTSTTTSTPPGGILTLSDNFQGSWNSAWTWIDPNDDVTYDFTAHPGFLRLTVPENNDLAAEVNYDAPRLLVPKNGDFTIETKIEFDPQEIYQGAGLLIWQDENTFMRLEFSYGGMGGIAKNVVFCSQEFAALGVVSSVDLPDTQKNIELRLQRKGDEFTTSYRQVGGTWQEIGSTTVSLSPTVDIGIAQVTQYTSTVISADFDYVKIYTP
jgi:regulation of enolase protein 1 (concanavalin A-like superfamily)